MTLQYIGIWILGPYMSSTQWSTQPPQLCIWELTLCLPLQVLGVWVLLEAGLVSAPPPVLAVPFLCRGGTHSWGIGGLQPRDWTVQVGLLLLLPHTFLK